MSAQQVGVSLPISATPLLEDTRVLGAPQLRVGDDLPQRIARERPVEGSDDA